MRHHDKKNNALATILDNAATHYACDSIIFTEPGESFVNSKSSKALTIVFILKGVQNIYYYRDGEIVQDKLEPGKILFSGPHCPWALDWQYPCHRLGASCHEDSVGISWNCHKQPTYDMGVLPDLWLTSRVNADSDLLHLYKALNARRDFPADSQLTCQLPKLILMRLQEVVLEQNLGPIQRRFDTFSLICHYMESNYNQPLSRKLIADTFNLNPDYVTRLFHEKGGVLFSHYLRDLRLRQAEELLRNSTLSIQVISKQTGFSDSSYFIKVFRKKHNCSPGEYRSGRFFEKWGAGIHFQKVGVRHPFSGKE